MQCGRVPSNRDLQRAQMRADMPTLDWVHPDPESREIILEKKLATPLRLSVNIYELEDNIG